MQYKHQYKKDKNRAKDEWRTPDYIFNPLNDAFGFTLDAAATQENAKVEKFYTFVDESNNGIANSWQGETVFCNSPYTEGQYATWIKKASEELTLKCTSVLLLPGSWETKAFETVWARAKYMIFPYKRIKFEHPDVSYSSAPFASLIPVFTYSTLNYRQLEILSEIGRVIDLEKGHITPRYLPIR